MQSNPSLYNRLTRSRKDNKLTDEHGELFHGLRGAEQSPALAAAADLPDQLGLFASEAANPFTQDLTPSSAESLRTRGPCGTALFSIARS